MRELTSTGLRVLAAAAILVVSCVIFAGTALAAYPLVKSIQIKSRPFSLAVQMTGRAPVKVIRIGEREVLVAIKNATLAKGLTIAGKDNPQLESVHVETLEGNVIALMMTSRKPNRKTIDSSFNSATNQLVVVFNESLRPESRLPTPAVSMPALEVPETSRTPVSGNTVAQQGAASSSDTDNQVKAPLKPALEPAVSKSEPAPPASMTKKPVSPAPEAVGETETGKQKAKVTGTPKRVTRPPVYIPVQRQSGPFKGDVSDMFRNEEPLLGCETKAVVNALLLVKKQLYKEAGAILDQYLYEENADCLEQVHYLRAYVHFMAAEKDDAAKLLTAERMFQDAVVAYPKSSYLPFAYAAMGLIQYRLRNTAAAEGYFDIIREGYPEYSGMPEVEYHLADIYDGRGYTDKAMRLYKKVFESRMNNAYIPDAGLGYGKALFKNRRYFDALSILNFVIKNDVKKVYESADLLRYTADASFELGMNKEARLNYIRLLNIFPDIEDPDMALSRAGDAYGMDNQEDKAIRLYELVREKYPDSLGFINASIGIARYLKTDAEKIEIYEMIKNRFPENTYARIAMMRLAEIYQKNGEYNKCIQEIEDLLSTHPRGLRYEAVRLMQKAYEALFKEQMKADEYTSVLKRYELERLKIGKMSSREIPYYVGSAYLRAGLYEQAFNQLISAYKLYKRSERPSGLLFGLGRAMDESGRDDDAIKLLDAFAKRYPKDKRRVEALTRVGRIYLEKNRFTKADQILAKAYEAGDNSLDKGRILLLRADVFQEKTDLKTAAGLREQAVKAFSASPGENYDILSQAYKILGTTYLEMKSYVSAADAFAKALDFSEGDRARANLGFLLGDAYQKGNVLDKAKKTFEHVAQSYDSVWARLAQQRLTTINLAEKMINS